MGAPLAIAFAASKRSGFPEAITLNCYSEKAPTKATDPEALIARPGLEDFETVGTAPIRGVFQKAGLLNDAAFIVCNDTAYLVTEGGAITTLSGTITGSGLVEIDGGLGPADTDYASIIRIANGTTLYKYDSQGTTVVDEGLPATSVAFFSGYWIYTEAGSDAVYRQNPASSAWSAIDFASAEYAPDPNKGVRAVGDIAWLLGSSSTEGWRLTGNSSAPMEPAGGLKFDIGCRNISAAVNCGGTLIWVDDKGSVQLTEGGPPSVISDNGLAEQIRRTAAADLSASWFAVDQHWFYVLHLGTAATWAFDLTTRRWVRFASPGYDYWRARMFVNIGDTILATDRLSSQVSRLDPDRRTDGDEPFQVEFCAFADVQEGALDLANVELDCLLGDAPRSGQGSDGGVITLRISRDEGATWGIAREQSLGAAGVRSRRPRWNALGEVRAPGAILKFEVSDPVGRRFSAVRANVG